MSTCPDCGATYSPNSGGHCRSCCQSFANDVSAGAHRVGPFEPREARRCLTVEEMLAGCWPERRRGAAPKPFRLTRRGWTVFPEMSREALDLRRG